MEKTNEVGRVKNATALELQQFAVLVVYLFTGLEIPEGG
jgi:hypothetical protein